MREKVVVVHPSMIAKDLASGLSASRRKEAEDALASIQGAFNKAKRVTVVDHHERDYKRGFFKLKDASTEADLILLQEDDTTFLENFIEPGDNVEIMGADRNLCVKWAVNTAKRAGAKVRSPKTGTFRIKDWLEK